MKPTNIGEPISLSKAEGYVEAYKPIKDALQNKILKKINADDLFILSFYTINQKNFLLC